MAWTSGTVRQVTEPEALPISIHYVRRWNPLPPLCTL